MSTEVEAAPNHGRGKITDRHWGSNRHRKSPLEGCSNPPSCSEGLATPKLKKRKILKGGRGEMETRASMRLRLPEKNGSSPKAFRFRLPDLRCQSLYGKREGTVGKKERSRAAQVDQ